MSNGGKQQGLASRVGKMRSSATLADDAEVARLLSEIGHRLALAGESPYKARAYQRAAELLTLTMPLSEVIAQGRLREVPGVGAAIASVIEELRRRGTTDALERLRADTPASVLELLRIPGIGPEKVTQLYKRLGVATPDDLEQACREDRVSTTKALAPRYRPR